MFLVRKFISLRNYETWREICHYLSYVESSRPKNRARRRQHVLNFNVAVNVALHEAQIPILRDPVVGFIV